MLRLLDDLVLFLRRLAPGWRGRLAYRALQSVLAPDPVRTPVPWKQEQISTWGKRGFPDEREP